MSGERCFYASKSPPAPPRQARPRELLFEFAREHESQARPQLAGVQRRVVRLGGARMKACPRCWDERWICEAQPDQPSGHDGSGAGPGVGCPECNTTNPPQRPLGWQ
jgi:hypothetical protein